MSEQLVQNVNDILTREERSKRRRARLPGLFMTAALLLLVLFFLWQLYRLKLLPTALFAGLAAVFLLLVLLVFVLSRDSRRRGRCLTALLLTLCLAAVSVAGTYVAVRFSDTIKAIFRHDATETVVMQIYVRTDDPAASTAELKGETLGILLQIDRRATDELLTSLSQTFGEKPNTLEYNSPAQLVGALTLGHVRAIIINEQFLSLISAESSDALHLRALHSQEVIIPATTEADASDGDPKPILPPAVTDPDTGETVEVPVDPDLPDDLLLNAEGNCFAAFISGIDSRQGLISRSRSDVNIIAAVNPDTRQIVLISTPRDYYVLTPVSGNIKDKLTHAGNYGVEVARDTMEMIYNMNIDYWFRVDFTGFVKIIDALDGVDIVSEADFSSGGYTFRKGTNHVDGAAALAFARERYALGGRDPIRGTHQMEIVRAALKKAASSQILSSWDELLSALSDSFEMNLPSEIIASIVRRQLTIGGEWNIVTYSVSGTDDMQTSFSLDEVKYVMNPDWDTIRHARKLIRDVFQGLTVSE